MSNNKHLFFRIISNRSEESPTSLRYKGDYECFMDIGDSKISEALHSYFNFEYGDVYAWPVDNMTKEEIDELWDRGQRAFVLDFGYKEIVLYDIKIITHEDWVNFCELEKKRKTDYINSIVTVMADNGLLGEDLSYAKKDLESILI